jgi:hypothetical protein
MAVSFSALRTELLSSLFASTYSASILVGDDNGVADRLNSLTSAAVSIGTVFTLAMQQAVSSGEYAVLSAGQRDLWGAILTASVNGVAISNAQIRAQVAVVWSAGTATRASLLGLDARPGSRAEVLFGEGIIVTPTDVQKALRP